MFNNVTFKCPLSAQKALDIPRSRNTLTDKQDKKSINRNRYRNDRDDRISTKKNLKKTSNKCYK